MVAVQTSCDPEWAVPSRAQSFPASEFAGTVQFVESCSVCEVVADLPVSLPPAGHAPFCPQTTQDVALQVDLEVAAIVLDLETENKVELTLPQADFKEEFELLKMENRNLHEKLQHEIRLKEDLEKVSCDSQ